ncbi:SDR family oxidoreductase [Rhodalgimonas zhirmunskyi]|uniref:SDR family oxidoreductase n=1 Tax=Rhodalgimonas zhirmunskyi TaxID=2964767 RepID=A0AAJ1X4I3_9RHOB|nr:SDR family NAD(P)-dependent oxidoreductase [Rhodoalgimonas zhirmunskyi]MDQ2093154.1 SDR family oxidoreductase [Rhodoalgimonas zhirmunskyi]
MSRNDPRLLAGTAIVTGAGGGLGRAITIELAHRGLHVAALGRHADTLSDTASANPAHIHPIPCDITDESALRAAVKQASDIAPLTLLINNAATYPRRDFLDETPQSFRATMDVNFTALMTATHIALETFVETGFGRILNVATFADLNPLPTASAYSVSKGAARLLTRALKADLADRFPEIVITDWMPGMLATSMGLPDGLPPEVSAKWGADLALWHDPTLTGATFEQDHEILPPRGLKRKLKDALLLRRPKPRQLT